MIFKGTLQEALRCRGEERAMTGKQSGGGSAGHTNTETSSKGGALVAGARSVHGEGRLGDETWETGWG